MTKIQCPPLMQPFSLAANKAALRRVLGPGPEAYARTCRRVVDDLSVRFESRLLACCGWAWSGT
jgi:hypothetical protein